MANRIDTYTTRIFLNSAQAEQKIKQLQDKIVNIRKGMEDAAKENNWPEFNKLKKDLNDSTKQLNAMRSSAQKVSSVLNNLSGASFKEIKNTIRAINRELRSGNIERGSDKWVFLTEQLKACNKELKSIGLEESKAADSGKSLLSRLNNIGFALTNLIGISGGIGNLSSTIQKSVADFAQMDEQMANTRKYTGMTDEQVRELNEDFKKIDTRTSREQLNDLAGAAGRLGITSKESVEEFVDAADKISVALGDDLGEGAVDQVGKLAMAFGEDDRMGLRKAMLATGSAINELAQNSAANAGYLVDFAARVAGVGKQVGLTQAQIMGFGAVMDENMLQDEMASTAFSQMMTKMQTSTSKFAKIAGMDVKSFTNLVKNDFNSAILALADNLKKQDPEIMIKMLTDMGLDGTRAVSVLSNLADKIDDVRKMQEIANNAYSQGTSVIGEFNTMNNTTQAELDKAKKKLHELSIEFGEQLRPATIQSINVLGVFVSILTSAIGFVSGHISTIARLAAEFLVLRTVVNISTVAFKLHYAAIVIWEKGAKALAFVTGTLRAAWTALTLVATLCTKGVKAYTAALNEAKAASATNPWTALATVILSVGVAVYELIQHFSSEQEEARKAADATNYFVQKRKTMDDVEKEANQTAAESITKVNMLKGIVENSNATLDDRKKALLQLKQMVPSYHGALTKEGKLINNNVDALTQYCNHLIQAARAQAAFNKMVEIQGNTLNHQSMSDSKQKEIDKSRMGIEAMGLDASKNYLVSWSNGKAYLGLVGQTVNKQIALTKAQYQQYVHLKNVYDYNVKRKKQEDTIISNNNKISEDLEQQVKSSAQVAANTKETNKNQGGNGKKLTGYQTDAEKRATQTAANKAAAAARHQESEARKREAEAKRRRREAMKREIDDAKNLTDQLQAQNTVRYYTGEIDYREYTKKQHQIAVDGLEQQKSIYKKYGDESKQLEADIAKEEYEQKQSEIKQNVSELERQYKTEQVQLKAQLYDPSSDLYNNEDALNERLFKLEYEFLEKKKSLQKKGFEEYADIEAQIEELLEQHKLDLAQKFEEKQQAYREQWGKTDLSKQKQLSLEGLEQLKKQELANLKEVDNLKLSDVLEHNEKVNEITKRYAEMRLNILRYYALQESQQNLENSKGEQFKKNSKDMYDTASNNAKATYQNDNPTGEGVGSWLGSDVTIFSSTIANLKSQEAEFAAYHAQLVKDGAETQEEAAAAVEENHKESMAAMGQATADMCAGIASKMQSAYDAISPIMDAMSSYYSAQCDLEVTQTQKKYEKLIDKAGNNSAKQKKLQEKQEKEIAKIKTKYNRKQTKMQIAQAIAQTAMSALSAYASVMAGAPWPANQVLAPIAAGLALAAGAIQIATIKKQAEAQEAGYYEGGFTDGHDYRREAGVVHQGEFVANHVAVNNPQLLPAFRLIDMAQRNNTVGSLTASDVSQSLGVGGTTVVSAPSVVVNQDNSDIAGTLTQARDTIERLGALLEDGVNAVVTIDGPNGLDKQYRRFKRLKDNV